MCACVSGDVDVRKAGHRDELPTTIFMDTALEAAIWNSDLALD